MAVGYWLGNPDVTRVGMIHLPPPNRGISSPLSRSTIRHDLSSGGVTTTRRVRTRRSNTQLAWSYLTPTDDAVIRAFHAGLYGPGPFAFVDPTLVNLLRENSSSAGAVTSGVPDTWIASTGTTVPYAGATAMPVAGTAAVQWTGAGAASYVGMFGASATLTDGLVVPPILPSQAATFSCYVRTVSGTATLSLNISQGAAGATSSALVVGSTSSVSSAAWTRLSAVYSGTGATGAYFVPFLVNASAGAPVILIAAPQFEYAGAATAWSPGAGVARVVIADDLPSVTQRVPYRDVSLVLAEV